MLCHQHCLDDNQAIAIRAVFNKHDKHLHYALWADMIHE